MDTSTRVRIYMTGVGGQGTLTATTLLARVALAQGMDVVAGEIHGMAQRGGVVESFVLLGGWQSPKLGLSEADIMLGFEPLEVLRGLPYLKPGGRVFASSDNVPSPGVCVGAETAPELTRVTAAVKHVASEAWFFPTRRLGEQAGAQQSGNTALLGALCASGLLPFGIDALCEGIRAFLPPKVVEVNMKAAELGKQGLAGARL